jgi:hypothetical protein
MPPGTDVGTLDRDHPDRRRRPIYLGEQKGFFTNRNIELSC